jgi:plastocyanin
MTRLVTLTHPRNLVVLAFALIFALPLISQAQSSTSTPEASPGASPEASPGASPAAGEVTITILDFAFEPATVTVPLGTTITWVNQGPTQHTTVSFDGPDKIWDSKIMEAGDTYSYTPTELGTYEYLCGLHPNMKATLIVTE